MKDILDKLDNILNEGHLGELADRVELDHEVQMARADLYKIAKYAIKLHDMLKSVSEVQGIEGWQQSKITKAADYLGSVYHNMDYAMSDMNPVNYEADQMDDMAFDLAAESVEEAGYSDAERRGMDNLVKDVTSVPSPKVKPPVPPKKDDDPGMERDRTTGNPADGIGAAAAAANKAALERRRGKTNESKFSDWGKK